MLNKLQNGYKGAIKLLCIHFSLTTLSLPILVFWGLPISLLSPISSLLIAPFISAYLVLTSLIFFSELLYLPNTLLYWLLESTSQKLLTILAYKPFGAHWMIGFVRPAWPILIVIILLSYFLLFLIRNMPNQHKLFYLCGYLLLIGIALKLQTPATKFSCTYRSRTVQILQNNNKMHIFDPGALAMHASGHRWFSFTVMPTIIQHTGKTKIESIVIAHPRMRTINALKELIERIPIKTIYLSYWHKNENKTKDQDGRIINLMYQLKHKAQYYDCTVKFINEKQSITINDNVIINAEKKQSSYQNITYRALNIV